MIAHAWVHSLAQNNRVMIDISGIEEYLALNLHNQRLGAAMMLPARFGDQIYVLSEVILTSDDNTGVYFTCNRLYL